MAPEVVNKQDYNESCDMWSCGVIMYFLITGALPFKGATKEETLSAITNNKVNYESKKWDEVDPEAKKLVQRLLDRNPLTRIKASEALEHVWICKFCSSYEDEEGKEEILVNTLRNLKNFKVQSVLQKSVLIYIASQFIDPKEEQKLSKLFNEIDTNKDGQVTESDLYKAYLKIFQNSFMAKKHSMSAIKRADLNGNGAIDYTGIVNCYLRVFNSKYESITIRK